MKNSEFIIALKKKDIKKIRQIPKSDLHNHGVLGGNLSYIKKKYGINIARPKKKFNGFWEMQRWIEESGVVDKIVKFEQGIESAFVQAKNDGVKILEMSIDTRFINNYGGDIKKLVSALKNLHKTYAPEIIFRPEIGVHRWTPVEKMTKILEPYFDCGYFKSIDLYGDEFAQPIKKFKKIYREAKKNGLVLKAHIGEFGNAESIKEAVEELELSQVQHGNCAADSKEVMKFLADNKIQLNLSPISNIMLSIVKDYKTHPIRILYDFGVKVTINTDDVIIFNQGVSEEFLNLYKSGTCTAEELNEIRNNGLQCYEP